MVRTLAVTHNPRRWSLSFETKEAPDHIGSLWEQVFTFTFKTLCDETQLRNAIELWIATDERLRMSLSPQGKILYSHNSMKWELGPTETFAKDYPFFWTIHVQTQASRIECISVLFRGVIGADSALVSRLSSLITGQKTPVLMKVPKGKLSVEPESLIAGLPFGAPPSVHPWSNTVEWGELKRRYPKTSPLLLAAGLWIQALRILSPKKSAGLILEGFDSETLGPQWTYVHSTFEAASEFLDIMTSLELKKVLPLGVLKNRFVALSSIHSELTLKPGVSDFTLRMTLDENGDPIEVRNTSCRIADTINRMLHILLKAAAEGKEFKESGLQIEALRFLIEVNATQKDYPKTRTIPDLLDASFHRYGSQLAVESSTGSMTYAELNQASEALARHLLAKGYGPGDLIGIGLPRDPFMLVAVLGVLKTGAGYVPLDPSFPVDRLRYMAQNAQLKACLCGDDVFAITQDLTTCITIEEMRSICSTVQPTTPDSLPTLTIDTEDIAYVIYTSGSTGLPKGVMLSHRSVINFLRSMQEVPGMQSSDKILAVTTLSFDIAVLEIFLPLLTGASIYLANSEEAKDGKRLKHLLDSNAITHFQATPSAFRLLLDAGWKGGTLKKALCGGEAFPLDVARRLFPFVAEIWNMYGPTETTVWSSIYRLNENDAQIPIGYPIANTFIAILDDELQPVFPGQRGEIYIGGTGLALGYIHRADLTAERFLHVPSVDQVLYKTGDIGTHRWDGCLEIFGRSDSQVKLRGYRMELGEIEAVISRSPAIGICVTMVKEFGPEDSRLIAYIQTKGEWNERDFRQTLRTSLPTYMVPQHFVVMSEFPLTPNGKIDRKALPHPQSGSIEADASLLVSRKIPVTLSQARMLYVEALDSGSTVHNLLNAWVLPQGTDDLSFRQALFALVSEQEALRMSIKTLKGQSEIIVHPPFIPTLEHHRFSTEDEARVFIESESRRPIDLGLIPTFRLGIAEVGHERIFYLYTHHVFWDGFSYGVFWKDLQKHYQSALLIGTGGPVPATFTYSTFTTGASTLLQNPKDAHYWHEQFATQPEPLELGTDKPRPSVLTHEAGTVTLNWDAPLDERLNHFAKTRGVTPYHVLLTTLFALLHRLSRQDDLVIGTPVHGRSMTEAFDLLGNFINVIALRARITSDMNFDELLKRVKDTTESGQEHSNYPIEVLVADLKLPRDLSRTPLYNCMFFFQDHSSSRIKLGDAPVETFAVKSQTVDTDLVFWMERHGKGTQAGINFRKDLWEPASIAAMAAAYQRLLHAFITGSNESILAPALAALEPTKGESSPPHRDLWSWLAETAQKNPEKIAFRTFDGHAITYASLLEHTLRLAGYLQAKGIQSGDVVGVSLNRNRELIPTLWSILALGASYLPLDPQYPSDRLQYMASDAKAKLIITELEHILHFQGLNIPILAVDRDAALIATAVPISLTQAAPEGLAYIIYTSGSTGKPKGVEIGHNAVCVFLNAISQKLSLNESMKTLAITTISFDISVLEIFATLVNGGELVLVPQESVIDGRALIDALTRYSINFLQATPASWRLLLESGWEGQENLVGLCGGEALPKDLARSLVPHIKALWNVYGPTEATVWATAEQIIDPEAIITIGLPLPNYQAYILDAKRQPLPQGTIGDLYLGGEALAHGYRFRPDLTAERFFPHPLIPGGRIYDTGDLARVRVDGKIEYISRRDNQVKLRGFRIELGEIEAIMIEHPAIKQAMCIVRQESEGDARLVAYAVLEREQSIDLGQLHMHLRAYLPQYMLPNSLVVLAFFPLTQNGKIDKKTLPAPVVVINEKRIKVPLNEAEARVAAIFSEVLGIKDLAPEDNFFNCGGHSMLALRVIHKLSEIGITVQIRDLLLRTIAQIAHEVKAP